MKAMMALVLLLAASSAGAQTGPLEIPGAAVYIPYEDMEDRYYGAALVSVDYDGSFPLQSPLEWTMSIRWIERAPSLPEFERHVFIWYTDVGNVVIQFSEGVLALLPAYPKHSELIAAGRWFHQGRLVQWYLTLTRVDESGHLVEARIRIK